jgi:uncharacterized protein
MKKGWKVFAFVFVGMLFVVAGVYGGDRIDFPNPVGYVNDFANVLTIDSDLDNILFDLDETDGTQILVITTDELPREVVLETFIPRLTDNNSEWAAGQEDNDNGVIFTIVVDDRTMRIDPGYGLEGALPDITTRHIQDDYVKPYFQEGDYDGGVRAGVDKIIEAVKGEYTVEDVESEQKADGQLAIIMVLLCLMPWMGAFLGRTKSWWLGGVIGSVMGLFVGMFRSFGLGLYPVLFGSLGLLFDYIFSKNYKKRVRKGLPTGFRSSWGGFSSGGHSSGGSSGSSFSSGGGSFGGGGSSSSW